MYKENKGMETPRHRPYWPFAQEPALHLILTKNQLINNSKCQSEKGNHGASITQLSIKIVQNPKLNIFKLGKVNSQNNYKHPTAQIIQNPKQSL